MTKKIFFTLLFLTSFQVLAQDSLSKNHFTFSLVNGVSQNKSTVLQGKDKLETSSGVYHGLNFQYTRNLTDHFSVSGIAGFGFLPSTYKVAASDSFAGTSFNGYFGRSRYQVFSNLALQAAYRNKISAKYAYRIHAGMGIKNFPNSTFLIGGSGTYGTDYLISGEYKNYAKPYLTIGAGVIKSIRNKDEISLHLSYEQFFRDVYSGTYYLHGGSSGTFANSGSNFNLALAYTFTGSGKNEKIRELGETNPDRKTARKLYRKEIRYIDPRTTFISISGGIGFGINKVNDPGNYFQNGTFSSGVLRTTVEKGVGKDYFAEAGFNVLPFWATMKTKDGISGSSAFTAYQISLGAGKRIITKNNYNLINFHAGLSFGVTNLKKGNQGLGIFSMYQYDSTGQQQQLIFQGSAEYYATKTCITSAYIGASKDFRLARNFYLTLQYRFQQGFYSVYEQRIHYVTVNDPEIKQAKITINGSSHAYQLGFKLKINPKKSVVIENKRSF